MYMQGFKCNVTGNAGSKALAPAKPPVWCEDNSSKCVSGAKQMIFWQQADGNNVGNLNEQADDLSGNPRFATYNNKMGFSSGKYPWLVFEKSTVVFCRLMLFL